MSGAYSINATELAARPSTTTILNPFPFHTLDSYFTATRADKDSASAENTLIGIHIYQESKRLQSGTKHEVDV